MYIILLNIYVLTFLFIYLQVQRLQEEIINYKSKLASWESERMSQVRCTYDAWQRETEDLNTKLKITEQQRDEVNIFKYKLI